MVVETSKNQIVLNQIIGQKKENRQVETDVIVNDIKPDVLKVISTNGVINIYKKEVLDEKVRIDGEINTYIIYMADDENGSIRSLNTSIDFTQIVDVDNCKENMQAQIEVKVKNFETKIINGRKLNVKVNIETLINIYANESYEIITGIENEQNIQLLNNTQKITSLIGSGSNRVIAKDTVAVNIVDDIAEIMKVDFKISDEETKISYNKVLSKADAEIEIVYITEDNRINTVRTKIPIMGFVDIQDVNEGCDCEIQNSLMNLIIKPNNNDEHSIYIEIEIEVTCSAYERKEVNIIEDLYSLTDDINFTKKEINAVVEKHKIMDICTIKENIRMPELSGNVINVQATPTINSQQVRKGKILYEGNLNLEILFEQGNGINSRDIDLNFNFDIKSDIIDEKSNIETYLNIKQNDFIINDGIIEIMIGIEFNILEYKNKVLNIIEEINMEECKDRNIYSMVIYFVKPGDSLWKIAKIFKSTVDDIARINDIEKSDMIHVGQQLYIPRFCKSQVLNG